MIIFLLFLCYPTNPAIVFLFEGKYIQSLLEALQLIKRSSVSLFLYGLQDEYCHESVVVVAKGEPLLLLDSLRERGGVALAAVVWLVRDAFRVVLLTVCYVLSRFLSTTGFAGPKTRVDEPLLG